MDPTTVTVVTDRESNVAGRRRNESLLINEAALPDATGWTLKPEGLCQGDVCVPVRDRSRMVDADGLVDLGVMAAALRRPYAVEPEVGLAVLGDSVAERSEAMSSLKAPDFTLPDLEGQPMSLADFSGKKRLLVAFASW